MYQELYYDVAKEKEDNYESFYTRYMMNIAVNSDLCKFYGANKRKYKQMFLYSDKCQDMLNGIPEEQNKK